MLDRPLELSVHAVQRIARVEELGELHVTLAPTPVWLPRDEERAQDAAALRALAELGEVDSRGRVDPDLRATLALLCRPRTEFYGWITSGDRTIAALAAAAGRDAVLAVRVGETLHLRQIDPDRLPDALVAQVPDAAPGRGQAITVTPAEPSTRQYTTTSRAAPELALAQRIASLPTTGGGQLYVAVRDNHNRRTAVPQPVRYADTSGGRWLNLTLPGNRVLIAPASKPALAKRLRDLHQGL